MTTKQIAIFIFTAILLVFCAPVVNAANVIEKLMMPGELSQPHAKFEENCENCHKVLVKEAQSGLCIDCHKETKQDAALKRGFHGKDPIVNKSECFSCHVEHKGRDGQIVRLEPLLFNHENTEYPLTGGHKSAPCAGCHAEGKKFREAKHACIDCHAKEEPHKGQLGTACADCHSTAGWRKVAAFDHSKTKFPLKGKHSEQPCVSCHVGEVYKNLPMGCNDCHAIQDVHAGAFGTDCASCHNNETWKTAKFDHNKNTRFPLLGSHAKAICSDCHGQDVRAKISMACFDCHRAQDVHKTELGRDCGSCHKTITWAADISFDHDLTTYPLIGMHAVVACESCHESKAYKGAKTACVSCHAGDDVHAGRFTSGCESCHSPVGWQKVSFNHNRNTSFALTGAHSRVDCYECHTNKNVKTASLPTTCISCHKKQDVHRGAFGANCASCHTTTTFKTAFIRKQ
jgi:hypothetical protein